MKKYGSERLYFFFCSFLMCGMISIYNNGEDIMKKLNDRAFTMVELIAAIAIMAILMLIIIPSVFSIVEKNKKTTYLNDAKQLITMAKNQYESDPTIAEPTDSLCLVFRLKNLKKSGLEKGPNGGKYNGTYSYVTINYESGKYIYGVQLVEEYSTRGKNNYRGIAYTKQANLQKNSVEKITNSIDNYIDLSSLSVSTSCPNGLVFSDGSNEDDFNSNINDGDTLKVYYRVGSNVEEIGSEKGECTVQNSKKYCVVTLPSIKAKDGYSSVGWSRSKGSRSGDKNSIYLTKLNSVYYANAIDDLAPSIHLSKQEDQTYTKEKKIDVDLEDLGVGLNEGVVIKYGWSLSNNIEPENYVEVKPDYHEGTKKVTFQAEGSNLNGNYYLWVVPIRLQDLEGNENKKAIVSEGVFKYNITRPICKFTNINPLVVGDQETVLLTCIDNETDVISYDLSVNDLSLSSDDGKIVSVSAAREVANGYEYQVVVEGVGTGNFSLTLSNDKIQNNAGNMNEEVTSSEIAVSGKTYYVQYVLGDNMSGIDGGENSCTTSGKSLECEITLPTIKVNDGYFVDGWYLNDTKVGEDGKYKISGDVQLNAVVQLNEYIINYNYKENGGEVVEINPDSGIVDHEELGVAQESARIGKQIIKENEFRIKVTKSGWEFVGWNTNQDEVIGLDNFFITNMFHINADGTTSTPYQNGEEINLYPIFRKEKTANVYYYYKPGYELGKEVKGQCDGWQCHQEISCYLYNNALDEDVCNFVIPEDVGKSAPEGFNYVGLLSDSLGSWTADMEVLDPSSENSIEYTSANSVYYAVYHSNYLVNYIKEDTVDNIVDGNLDDVESSEPETDSEINTREEHNSSEGISNDHDSSISDGTGTGEEIDLGGETGGDEPSTSDDSGEDIKDNTTQVSVDVYLYYWTGYDQSYKINLPKIIPHRGHTNARWTEILDNEGTRGNIFAPEQEYTLTSSITTFSASAEDIEKPIWSIVSVEKDCNDLMITIQGGDTSGQVISNLDLDKLSLKIGGKENTQVSDTSLVSPPQLSEVIGGSIQHVLTIKNYNQTGEINVIISEKTLRDVAGNTSENTSLTYSDTEIYDLCEDDDSK